MMTSSSPSTPVVPIAATLLTLGAACMTMGCGEANNDDVFYAYIVHGYAGGGEINIYSNQGPLLQQPLRFGEATEEPIAIDRRVFDGTLEVLSEGMTQPAPVQLDQFAFYPQETITVFINKRTGINSFEARVLRHTLLTGGDRDAGQPAPAYTCATQFQNGLSLTNNLTDERYDIQMQFNHSSVADRTEIYNEGAETEIPTECGPLQITDTGNLLSSVTGGRQTQLNVVVNDPWYFLVENPNADETGELLTYRYGIWDAPSGDSIRGIRSSQEYVECLAGAISISPEMGGGMMMPTAEDTNCEVDANGNSSIPTDANGFPAIDVDQEAVQKCLDLVQYTGRSIRPQGGGASGFTLYYNPFEASPEDCSLDMRMRTRAIDSVFDPPDRTGPYVRVQTSNPTFTWQHVVIYGRPIEPFVYQVTASDQSEDFTEVEYPNDQSAEGVRTGGGSSGDPGGTPAQ